MRDINRIERVIDVIRDVWYAHPDFRLGQLLCNLTDLDQDLFYLEDEKVMERLKEVYGHQS